VLGFIYSTLGFIGVILVIYADWELGRTTLEILPLYITATVCLVMGRIEDIYNKIK